MTEHMRGFRGLARRQQLRDLGYSTHQIRVAVATGHLRVPRRGWVATGEAPVRAVRAIELGGRIGGATALASYGIWVDDPTPPLVVVCPPGYSRAVRLREGEIRLWVAERFPSDRRIAWRVSVLDALLQLARTASREELISSIDSAVHTRQLSTADQRALFAALPRRFGNVEKDVDGASMSGTETRLRLAIAEAGYRVRSQARLDGVGDADLIVDEWLIVEGDSRGHHGSSQQQTRDRARDGNAVLSALGHERFMWSQVRYSMDWCMAVIEQRLRDGRPDRPPVSRSEHLRIGRSSG